VEQDSEIEDGGGLKVAQEFVIYCMGNDLEKDIRVLSATSI